MPTAKKRSRDENSLDGDSSPQQDAKRPRVQLTSPVRALKKLLEFWLSDANLSKDKHLTSAMLANNGWIPAAFFLTFNRVVELSVTEIDIIAALREVEEPKLELESTSAGVARIRLAGGAAELKRKIELARRDEDARTIYVETLPQHARREQLTSAMSKFGEISYVSLPRYPDGRGKGFAFVEFQKADAAATALERISEVKLDIADPPALRAITREEWRKRKELYKESLKTKKRAAIKAQAVKSVTTEQHSPKQTSSLNDRDTASNQATPSNNVPTNQPTGPSTQQVPNRQDGTLEPNPDTMPFEKGLIVSVSGLKAAKRNVTRRSLFQAFKEYGSIAYVDFSPKDSDICKLRFRSTESAQAAVDALSPTGGGVVLGTPVTAHVLKDEAETKYWSEIHSRREEQAARRKEKATAKAARRAEPRVQPARSGKKEET